MAPLYKMKQLHILLFFFMSVISIDAQDIKQSRFNFSMQVSHLYGKYLSSDFDKDNFFANYYLHPEINYSIMERFSVGGYIAYTRGQERELITTSNTGSGTLTSYSVYSSNIFILGANVQYNFPEIILKNILGVDGIKFYSALEYGYLLYDQVEPASEPVRDNGWIYGIGLGANFFFTDKFFLNTEIIYSEKLLYRFGFGFRI